MSGSNSSYRDRIYIVKDIILKLLEYSELNQTALVSFCGLNLKKHKPILVLGLPVAIATMHFAWGAGFLWSCIAGLFVKNG